jgi:hypothetical protein
MFSGAHGSGVDVMVAVGVMGVEVGVGGFAVELGGGEAMITTCSQAETSGSITRSIARKNRDNFFMDRLSSTKVKDGFASRPVVDYIL